MSLDGVFGIAGALVTVALVTTIVSHKNSAGIVKSVGDAFIWRAQGRAGQLTPGRPHSPPFTTP